MLRFLICPVLPPDETNEAYRAAIENVPNTAGASIIPTDPLTGLPKYSFAISLCDATLINQIMQLQNTYVFPDYNLDGRMDGMEPETRAAFVQSVQAYVLNDAGLHFDATHQDSDSYRFVVEKIGKKIEPQFSVNALNVGSVPG